MSGTVKRLNRGGVERIWGRLSLPPGFEEISRGSKPIGEIWFADALGVETELLVKYLFTSDRLSVQVHPDDITARAHGYPRGKDEAWYIIDADPNAVIGLGLNREISSEELRSAALEGRIEELMAWHPVNAGSFIYSRAGTIHAIGAGLSLIEIQQNLDLTYRLYDYGRPRKLHLEEGIAVAKPGPYTTPFIPFDHSPGRRILAAGLAFVLERWTFDHPAQLRSEDGQLQLIPVANGGTLDGIPLDAGTVWRVEGEAAIDPGAGLDLLAAYPGAHVREGICVVI